MVGSLSSTWDPMLSQGYDWIWRVFLCHLKALDEEVSVESGCEHYFGPLCGGDIKKCPHVSTIHLALDTLKYH